MRNFIIKIIIYFIINIIIILLNMKKHPFKNLLFSINYNLKWKYLTSSIIYFLLLL